MIQVAIVGCGRIADRHVHAINRISNCRIVSLGDSELLMAQQLGERTGVERCFADLDELLATTSPDVVHITTPPQSHYSLASRCLRAGANVYLEKPFTVTAEEAVSLIDLAEKSHLRITVGHNYQFTREAMEMRALVARGFLGGPPIHLESHWPYSLKDQIHVGPLLANKEHWVRQLPGRLFHNVISHGIARLAEFLDDELVEIHVTAHKSSELHLLPSEDLLDELRVLLRDRKGTTAFFCFSTQIRPPMNSLRVCGTSNSVVVDYSTGTLIRNFGRPYRSYLAYFVPPLVNAREQARNARRNLSDFLGQRLYQDFGLKGLIERFYRCIDGSGPPPIPYREIILTSRIMDRIFAEIYPDVATKL